MVQTFDVPLSARIMRILWGEDYVRKFYDDLERSTL
jgi:hypothetical protein